MFFGGRKRNCSPDKPTCGWISSKITMKGIFDKSAFLRNTINIERCLQSELPLKKVCSQNWHSYFFHTMINFRFSLHQVITASYVRNTFTDGPLQHLEILHWNIVTSKVNKSHNYHNAMCDSSPLYFTISSSNTSLMLEIIFQWEMQEILT